MAESQAAARVSTRHKVQEMLRLEDARSLRGALGGMLKGIGWCVVAGIVVATVMTLALDSVVGRTFIGWFGWFFLFLLVVAAGIFLLSRKKAPAYVVKPLNEEDDEIPASIRRDPIYAMLLSWGPRAILDGIAALRNHPTKRQTALYKRSARAIVDLAKFGGGVPVKEIMRPPEDMPIFTAALDWLERHDYTGKSSDGERIWFSSQGRKRLVEHRIDIKITDIGGG